MTVERVLDDPHAAAALLEAGGRLERHSIVMVLDLAADAADHLPTSAAAPAPAPFPVASPSTLPDGFDVAPIDPARAAEYAVIVGLAYPPGHLDHDHDDADLDAATDTLRRCFDGHDIGPFIPEASHHVTDASGRILGAIVINHAAATPAFDAGPFVTDVFVDPGAAGLGLGAALVTSSVDALMRLGHRSLTLVVTVGNPARRLYERLGFRMTHEAWRIHLDPTPD